MSERARAWAPFITVVALSLGMLLWMERHVDRLARGERTPHGQFPIEALIDGGLLVDELVDVGEIGRLATAGLVHTSWSHLAVNALGLTVVAGLWWRVTRPADRRWTRAWVVPAIMLSASGAGFLASYLVRAGPSCGASAGVYGLLAAVAGASWALRRGLPERVRTWAPALLTSVSLACVLVLLPTPTMDHAAHLGGWAFGLPLGAAAQHRAGRAAIAVIALGWIAIAICS